MIQCSHSNIRHHSIYRSPLSDVKPSQKPLRLSSPRGLPGPGAGIRRHQAISEIPWLSNRSG